MLSLFEKRNDGHLAPKLLGDAAVAASVDIFRDTISKTLLHGVADKVILVGSPSDLSWARISMPESAVHNIVAEIQYPLMPRWFKQSPDTKHLAQAIEQLLAN